MLADDVKAREEGVGVAVAKENEVGLLGFVPYLENGGVTEVRGFGIEYGIAVVSLYRIEFFGIGANPVVFRGEFPVIVVGASVFRYGVDCDVDVVFESVGASDDEGECHGESPEEGEE